MTCVGAIFATGHGSCWTTPVWAVTRDDGTVYACNRHVHGVLDSERTCLVSPVSDGTR